MFEIDEADAKDRFEEVLDRVSRGETITITRERIRKAVLRPPTIIVDEISEDARSR